VLFGIIVPFIKRRWDGNQAENTGGMAAPLTLRMRLSLINLLHPAKVSNLPRLAGWQTMGKFQPCTLNQS